MNQKPLFFSGDPTPVAYACGKCGRIDASESTAERCCLCHVCHAVEAPYWNGACAGCKAAIDAKTAADQQAKLLSVLRKATRLTEAEYDGPGCSDVEGDKDRYHETSGDWLDWLGHGNGADARQPFLFACHVEPVTLDVQEVLDAAEENQEVWDGFKWADLEELEEFVATWNERQPDIWRVDSTRVIVLDAVRFDALIAEEQGK